MSHSTTEKAEPSSDKRKRKERTSVSGTLVFEPRIFDGNEKCFARSYFASHPSYPWHEHRRAKADAGAPSPFWAAPVDFYREHASGKRHREDEGPLGSGGRSSRSCRSTVSPRRLPSLAGLRPQFVLTQHEGLFLVRVSFRQTFRASFVGTLSVESRDGGQRRLFTTTCNTRLRDGKDNPRLWTPLHGSWNWPCHYWNCAV